MACFLVPAAEAVVVALVAKSADDRPARHSGSGISWRTKFRWLTAMLWGGSLLLGLEHVWAGQVTWRYPFLTALNSADGTWVMLRELATVGVGMALLVTAVWAVMVVAVERLPKLSARIHSEAV